MIARLPRTSYATLFARRMPHLATMTAGLGFVLGWPHLCIAVANRMADVPPINSVYL